MFTVKIIEPNRHGNPPGKLAGLKLIGFAIWERRTGGGRNVTFPARQYSVDGERRLFALLRPIADTTGQERVRDAILSAYEAYLAGCTTDAGVWAADTTPAPTAAPAPAPAPAQPATDDLMF